MSKKITLIIILAVIIFGVVYYLNTKNSIKTLPPQEAKQKAQSFINENLLNEQGSAAIESIEEKSFVYKLKINLTQGDQTKEIDSYITKDGKLFFSSAIEIEEIENKKKKQKEQAKAKLQNIPKKENPKIELFVMSYCPYGTQMEKAMLPVINLLKNKVDFELKFCDYAMHGKKELDEQLLQYCVQKNHLDKFGSYLRCFLKDGKTDECLSQIGLKKATFQTCVDQTDQKYSITKKYNNKDIWMNGRFPLFDVNKEANEKYSIKGSPTLVINRKKIKADRDRNPDYLLQAVCAGFKNPPQECNDELSTKTPSKGFGFEDTGQSTDATCN